MLRPPYHVFSVILAIFTATCIQITSPFRNIREAISATGKPMRYDFTPGGHQICRCNVTGSSRSNVTWWVRSKPLQDWCNENNWSVIFDGPEISLTPPADTHVQTVRMFCTVDDEIVDVIDLWQKEDENPFGQFITSVCPLVPGYLLVLSCAGTTRLEGGNWTWYKGRSRRHPIKSSGEAYLVIGSDADAQEGEYHCTYRTGSKRKTFREFVVQNQIGDKPPVNGFFCSYFEMNRISTTDIDVLSIPTLQSPTAVTNIETEMDLTDNIPMSSTKQTRTYATKEVIPEHKPDVYVLTKSMSTMVSSVHELTTLRERFSSKLDEPVTSSAHMTSVSARQPKFSVTSQDSYYIDKNYPLIHKKQGGFTYNHSLADVHNPGLIISVVCNVILAVLLIIAVSFIWVKSRRHVRTEDDISLHPLGEDQTTVYDSG